ncbi:TonB-dependent receptor plug domain-containing protein [Microvirga massiliensis]|uniref:TonB-dependent receptor plug domain-containing protein n=1 Tax=Microvirga massiliensis TaxID=1033741 RepID=UPI000660FA32|nr:TonB-dependent receptor [Microvirga massiliensis]
MAASALLLLPQANVALAQTPDFVVTATRTPLAVTQAGSAITVISGEEIAKSSPKSIADVLRHSPGLSVTENGGPGGVSTVRLRGTEASQTLVLIDGVRVNNPSLPAGEFDFSSIVPTDIERIEVLRGPQSAIYGSDAIGGVINIITRHGRGTPRGNVAVEGGSYSGRGLRAAASGSEGGLSYAFSLSSYDTAGFSRYGYRIGRIERLRAWPLEPDATGRIGGSGRIGLELSPDTRFEIGGYGSLNQAQYDAAFEPFPDTASESVHRFGEGFARLINDGLGGALRSTITVSGSTSRRSNRDVDPTSWLRTGFEGDRKAAEYQGDLKLGSAGLLTFGTRFENETFRSQESSVLPFPIAERETNDASRNTRSAYLLHQITLLDNLHLSIGGRIDDASKIDRFATWRATAAYVIPQSGATLRTSIGTGAKAPSLFQLYDPLFGNPLLDPEYSFGVDAGVDQRVFEDRGTLFITAFANRLRNLIDFDFGSPTCKPGAFGCYVNLGRARTSGIEVGADIDVIPSWLRVRAAYTYLIATDATTGLSLPRLPKHLGRIGLTFTPMRDLSIEPSLVFATSRPGTLGFARELPPYARLDVYGDYRINDTFAAFARAENITDAEYQEIPDFGTAGRSFYAGLRATW